MIPIIDLCWQKFSPVRLDHATVGDLYELALKHGTEPFVVHDSGARMSALVTPGAATMAVDMLNLPRWESAVAVGMFDALRRNQMIVSFDQPARLVARLASWQGIGAVIAVNRNQVPVGLFIPGSVTERLPTSHWMIASSPTLQQSVTQLTAAGDLAGAIAALEAERHFEPGDFHSEQINEDASDAYTCGGDGQGGPHVVYRCPCGRHPSGICSKGTVAAT